MNELIPFNREIEAMRRCIDQIAGDDVSYHDVMVKLAALEDQALRLAQNAKVAINISVQQRNAALRELEALKAMLGISE